MKSRWQRRRQVPNHADDWLMTYADMITLLLCFFAVFLSVSLAKKVNVEKVQAPIEQKTSEPTPSLATSSLSSDIHPPLPPGLARDPVREVVEAEDAKATVSPPSRGENLLPALQPLEHPEPTKDLPSASSVEPVPPAPAMPPASSLPDIVDHLKAQGMADIEQKGDRITTMDVKSSTFFPSGSAVLSDAGKDVLRDVAISLKSKNFDGYQITVEGHTDDTPIKTLEFPSNWELSTARAAAVVHFFLDQGVPAQRLRAAGYADTFPKAPNRDAVGNPIPSNQAQNRRVVIKLEKIEKDN